MHIISRKLRWAKQIGAIEAKVEKSWNSDTMMLWRLGAAVKWMASGKDTSMDTRGQINDTRQLR